MYTQTQFPTDTPVKSHQKGVIIALFGFLLRLTEHQKQDSIFSILKTQPRLHDLENSVTENKAS